MEAMISMDESFDWFTTADLSEYEDMYIAIVDKKVISADEDPEAAYVSAREKYPDNFQQIRSIDDTL